MSPPATRATAFRRLPLALLLAAALLTGCVYRPDIQQGNLLTMEDVDQVTVGMTRSQVRYVLGTPMISDPFAPQRWDYVYRMTYGRGGNVISAHFVVYFEGDKVSRVEKLDLPEPPRQAQADKSKKKKQAPDEAAGSEREPPPAPPVTQPVPDAT